MSNHHSHGSSVMPYDSRSAPYLRRDDTSLSGEEEEGGFRRLEPLSARDSYYRTPDRSLDRMSEYLDDSYVSYHAPYTQQYTTSSDDTGSSLYRHRGRDVQSDVTSIGTGYDEVCRHGSDCQCFQALNQHFSKQINTLRSTLETATEQLAKLSESVSEQGLKKIIEQGANNTRHERRMSDVSAYDVDHADARQDSQPKATPIAPDVLAATASAKSTASTEEDDEEAETTCNRRLLIHPNNSFRRNWDLWIAICLLYNAIVLPYRVCFNVNSSGAAFVIETIIDSFVALDIFFNFRTAFFRAGVLVTNAREVAWHYAKTWFVVDLIATFPYDLVITAIIESNAEDTDDPDGDRASVFRLPRLVRLARLVRLVRLLRLLRLTRIWQKFQDRTEVHFGPVKILKVTFVLLLFTHWFGCFWFLLASLKDFVGTWAEAYGIHDASVYTQYISSVHFAFQSITTLGYGDILPRNDDERLFLTCVMLLGLSVYGWLLGSLASLIYAGDQRDTIYRDRMKRLNSYLEHHKVPSDLRVRIRAYVRHNHESEGSQMFEDELNANINNALRSEMSEHLNANILRKLPFLAEATPEALKCILLKLRVRSAEAGENICTAGRFGDQMYILVHGSAQVLSADETHLYATLEEGSYFGEIALMHSTRRSATVRAVTSCDLRSLSKADFDEVLLKFPSLVKPFEAEARARLQQIADVDSKTAQFHAK